MQGRNRKAVDLNPQPVNVLILAGLANGYDQVAIQPDFKLSVFI
jgi:hypothetical protein